MSKFQLLGCEINIAGDRDNTVVRDQFDPVTFPEFLVLRAIHGGADHVHSAVVVGYDERDAAAEKERLMLKYDGALVSALFPGAMAALPEGDVSIPTLDEVKAGDEAAKKARKAVRSGAPKAEPKIDAPKPEPIATKSGLPDLTT